MTTVKKVNGNLVIQTPIRGSISSNITLDTDEVIIKGNLTVLGNTSQIETNNTVITDNIIMLNYGETGPGVTLGTAGVIIDRGSLANVSLIWRENVQKWQITTDGSLFSNIATSGTGVTQVFEDKAPVLGANLNINGYTLYANVAATSYITMQGALQMKYANVTYTSAIGSTVLNAAAEGAGQTGLYVTGVASTNEELVSKRRAFGFSLFL